jgi:hypothetical protein
VNDLKLMPDYGCFPLWDVTSPDGVGEVDPGALPNSSTLEAGLLAWARRYDDTLDPDDPAASGFATAAEVVAPWRTREALGDRLRSELGPAWSVTMRRPSGRNAGGTRTVRTTP